MDEDDVPDLEDMTDFVQGIKSNQSKTSQMVNNKVKPEQTSKVQPVDTPTITASDMTKRKTVTKQKEFGGMEKGFLFGSSSKQRKKPIPDKDIITPKVDTRNEKDSLVFDEVQKVMNETSKMDKSWLTEDLLKQVESNDKLSKQLADPRIAKAIAWMQKDPKAAMEYYKNDTEIQTFFKEFYSVLGNHFTKLGAQQSQQTTETNASNSEEEKAVKDILSNPQLKEILMKPGIQKLIELLRNDPDEAQRLLSAGDAGFRADVNKLVSAGVLGFQQS